MNMTGARLALLTVLAALIAAMAEAIDVDDFYPFDKNSENHLPRADAAWSSEIVLSVPINYYNRTHSSVWVHTDGFVSFSKEAISIGSLVDTEFPLYESVIAPYMANLDISEQGHIVYEETHDSTVLARATDDVQRAFPGAAKDFEPQSVFIATWKNVKGFSLEGEPASFTFQLAIVSSGSDSFAIFLYPKSRMGSMEAGKKPRTTMFEAKAGFNMGGQKFLEMYPAENLVDYDNTQRKGEWIFQIGGEGVVNRDDVIDPERRRLVRRDALVNVQEVDLSDSFSDEDLEEERRMPERFFDYCARDGSACMVNNSMCVNHNDGYCCQCESGYVGNGRICADAYQNLMISGNVTGTVDIRHLDGTVNRVEVNSAFQGFSIVSLGRAHAALTPVPEELGAALKAIVPIGEISAWLFASSDSPAINGFDYTGGRFQRQLSIRFRKGGYRFDMRQRFHGAFFRNDELFVNATGHCVGVLPAVSLEQLIDVSDVESTYIREAPGRITMSATHSYSADGETYEYDVTETIIFSECTDSRNAVPSRLTLKMSNIFVQADQDTVRWAQDAKVEVSDHSSSVVAVRPRQPEPCDGGNKCGDGECIPRGRSYRCRCPQGQKEVFDDQNRSDCEEEAVYDDYNIGQIHACDIDEICGAGVCIEVADGFRCQCPEGYLELNENGFGSCQEQFATDDYDAYDPCEDNDCDVGRCNPDGKSYMCVCPRGYKSEVSENGRASCHRDGYENYDPCLRHFCGAGRCRPQSADSYRCQCPRGYREARNRQGKPSCLEEIVERTDRYDPCHLNDCGEGSCLAHRDSYRCDCPSGYRETLNSKRKASCKEEVVERTDIYDPCHLNDCGEGSCVANHDSYRCRCPRGYREMMNSDSKASCQEEVVERTDIYDPCHLNDCGEGSCVANRDSYRCRCPSGYREIMNSDSKASCQEEVVERTDIYDPCHLNDCGEGSCVANRDSYRCRCPRGYREIMNSDSKASCQEEVVERTDIYDPCHLNDCGEGSCVANRDSYRCRCPRGYREIMNSDSKASCQEKVVERTDRYDPCHLNDCGEGSCVANRDSYRCRCPSGYRETLNSNRKASCQEEVVERTDRYDPCHLNDCGEGSCLAHRDSYRCDCPSGYREIMNSDSKASCQEEVVERTHIYDPCHLNDCGEGSCVANRDSYRCRCPRGYREIMNSDSKASCQAQLPGLQNPCEVEGICGRVGQCRPDGNSYRCDCPQGFYEVQDTYGSRCEDIDECSQSDNICSPYADCNNYDGSYECVCKDGYNGDGRNCRPNERRDSRCERTRQYAMEKAQRGNLDVEIPECGDDGMWVRRQCNLDGACWCVEEETGTVVDGTRSNSGYVNCDDDFTGAPSGETKCQQQYREGQNSRRHNAARDVPDVLDCTPEGQFMKRQCTSYEDVCWCIQPDTGETIEGTMTEQGSGHLLDCDATRRNPHVETECERQYREAVESHNSNRPEDFAYPDCTSDGFFQKRQCAGFGDTCWCVDPYTGDEIEGTKSRSQRGLNLDCENLDNVRTETECQRQYREVDEMFRSNPNNADLEHPRCTDDGLFEKRQCMAWPDVCRCVDQYTGETIEGTITEPDEGHLLNCEDEDIALETECMRRLRLAQQQSADSPSTHVEYPDCNDDGMFNRRQCNSYDDSCWCVDEVTGEVVDGTRTARGRGTTLTCDVNDVQGPCDQGTNPCGVGTCVEAHGQHRCYCPDGYTEVFNARGSTCEVESAPVTVESAPVTFQPQHLSEFATCDEPSPCGGVGECVERSNAHHRCRCPSGYVEVATERGSKCEEAGDMCQSVPNVCSGKGECVPQRDTYRCRCNSGYSEYFVDGHGDCQSETSSPCSANPCGDYGDCVPDNHSYRCRCADGFVEVFMNSGSTCSQGSPVTPEEITDEGEEDSGVEEVTTEEPRRREESECMRQLRSSYRNREGQNVVCEENGEFEIRQCDKIYDICWCVDPQTGVEIQGTRTENGNGRTINCENPAAINSTTMTACQEDKWIMQSYDRNDEIPEGMYEPDCTNAGAYEPVQYYGGYYHCVDFNGLELSRHRSRPECYSPCQLAAYYANTENIFAETDNFVPECTNDGEYEPVQCDLNYCYCVDANGNQVDDSMKYVDSREARLDMDHRCQQGSGSTDYVEERTQVPYHEPSPPNQVIFAQGTGLQSIKLPIGEETKAQRLYDTSRRLLVGVDFDCATKYVYFSGVREPAIYRAPLDNFDQVETIVRRSLRSPEGVAVDHLSGNVYWADSGTRRIEVAKADGSMRTVIVSKGLVNPRGIAVDPVGGKLYWSDWHRQNPRIMIANMDGSEARVFVKEGLKLPNNVEIDLYHKKLCFVDAGTYMIECMNLDGTDRRVVADMSGDNKPRMAFGLEVSGGYVYYTDRKASRIHQIDMQTGEDIVMRGPMGVHAQMFGITLSYDECPRENNYCARDNGGCAENQLCLPVPHGRVCKCPKGSSDCVEQK